MTLLGEVYTELNDLNRGLQLATKGVELTERFVNIMILGFSYLNFSRVLFSNGDFAGVEHVVERAGFNLSSGLFLGILVKWFVIVVFLVAALDVLHLEAIR